MFEIIQHIDTNLIFALDIMAAISFAISGALVASRKGLDIIGFMWFAIITGVGGGTIRDLILDAPVFWIADHLYVITCIITATIMFFVAHRLESRMKLVIWFDALGLSFVTVVGTAKGLSLTGSPLIAIAMGVITAVVGGIIRDIVGEEKSIIMRREIYVTAAAVGASTYTIAVALSTHTVLSACCAFFVTFAIRGLAITYKWSMPAYRRDPK